MRLEHILLGLFSMRPWSGYDLKKWFAEGGKFFRSNTDQSQIYRLLGRMEADGWVSHTVDPREKRPDAKVYTITEAGRSEVLRWARAEYQPPARFQDADFLVRFVFGGLVDPAGLRELVAAELVARREQVAHHRNRDRTQHYENPIPEIDVARANLLFELSHIRGMAEIDSWINWLEEMLVVLESAGVTPIHE